MTVPKTVLVVAALLLAAAAAAVSLDNNRWVRILYSPGPYDYYEYHPLSIPTRPYYLLWFPPHAVPMNLTLLNVTWWKPEAIWFKGTYYVTVCSNYGYCEYGPATIYVVQDGVRVRKDVRTASYLIVAGFVEWHVNRICRQGIAMVAPNKIIVLNATAQIWISDVYCLYGNRWFWLRLLPYNLKDELEVEGIELVNLTDKIKKENLFVEILSNYPWPLVPAGWYIDPVTKRVFRIPNDTAVMVELQSLRMRVSELEAELANKTAKLVQLNATLMRLNATIAQLNVALAEARDAPAQLAAENQRLRTQLEELNATRIKLETEVEAYRSQLETLRASVAAQLAQLTAENQALKAQIASMNKTLAELNETYASQTAQLQSQLETWTRAAWIGAALGATAGAAAASLALRRRK